MLAHKLLTDICMAFFKSTFAYLDLCIQDSSLYMLKVFYDFVIFFSKYLKVTILIRIKIKLFFSISNKISKLLVDRYPDGYDDSNIIFFRNSHAERIEAVEVLTIDTKYLVKISEKLEHTMENYDEEDHEDFDDDDPAAVPEPNLL